MTATLNDVAKKKQAEASAEQLAAIELIRMAKEQSLSLTRPDGLVRSTRVAIAEPARRR